MRRLETDSTVPRTAYRSMAQARSSFRDTEPFILILGELGDAG
jgi:hypothetical protein